MCTPSDTWAVSHSSVVTQSQKIILDHAANPLAFKKNKIIHWNVSNTWAKQHEKDRVSHLPSNLCFRKSKRAFCIMSVTLAEGRRLSRGMDRERKKPKGRREVSRRQGHRQEPTALMGRTIPVPCSCHSAKSVINQWEFPTQCSQCRAASLCVPLLIQHHSQSFPTPSGVFVGQSTGAFPTQHC